MPHQVKLPPAEKAAVVKSILAGKISGNAAAKEYRVSQTTVRGWLRVYAAEGEAGFYPRAKTVQLSAEAKAAAVAEYMAGGVSLFAVCQKYKIRNTQTLQRWVDKTKAGAPLPATLGAARHVGTAYTTAAQRLDIVRECLANGKDYQAAALKYDVTTVNLQRWCKRYLQAGPTALVDTRHSTRATKLQHPKYTPQLRRLEIVLECLACEKNYGAIAEVYGLSYGQVYAWVQRYLKDGWAGLRERQRGSLTPTPAELHLRSKLAKLQSDADAKQWLHAQGTLDERLITLLSRAGYSWQMIALIYCDCA